MKYLFKFITLFLFCFSSLFSASDKDKFLPLADTEQSISCLVNGSVNAITGAYLESHQDLVIDGPQPLIFERSYSSSDYTEGVAWGSWRHNHISYFKQNFTSINDNPGSFARVVDFSGSSATYHGNVYPLKMHTGEFNKGLSNFGKGIISGRTNLKNTHIDFSGKDFKVATVKMGSGECRQYVRRTNDKTTPSIFNIITKQMPDGSKIEYKYAKGVHLEKVVSTSGDGKINFGSLNFSGYLDRSINYKGISFPKSTIEQVTVETNDGRTASYKFLKHIFKPFPTKYEMIEAVCTDKPTATYQYFGPKIYRSGRPDDRYLINEYYGLFKEDNPGIYDRIKLQKAPVGVDNTPVVTHRYFYHINTTQEYDRQSKQTKYVPTKGATEVLDALNQKTVYHFDENQRLNYLEKYSGRTNHQRYSLEGLVWGSDASQDFGNLICKYLEDGSGNRLCARVFTYDARGNVILDRFYGNLCGNNPIPVVLGSNNCPIDNGCDCYAKHCAYSNDGFNLLLAEVDPNGRYTQYNYVPGTDLLNYKIVSLNGVIKKREFFRYSKDGILIEKIEDDGCTADPNNYGGVTERRLSQASIRESTPGYGLPKEQNAYYIDFKTGQPVLLRKIVNAYSSSGCPRLIKQDHHEGSTGSYSHSANWQYDNHGNVIQEVNALGVTIYREYDLNDNLVEEKGPLKTIKSTYDYANRLIRVDEIPTKGPVLSIKHGYDHCGNRISTEDCFGNVTYFEYDEFGRLIKSLSPSVQDETGNIIQPVTTKTYDIFGNVTSLTDPIGNTITTTYNVRGKPITVHYPDGSSESFEYNIDATVRKSVAKNGMFTLYSYDYDGRPIQTEVYSPDAQLLTKSSATYNTFHMTSSTDAEGQITYFTYDGAGRKASISKNDHLTTFEYDNLGHLHKTREWFSLNENDVVVKIHEHDLLNRVIEERLEDGSGQVLKKFNYEYDVGGNRTKVTQHFANGPSTTLTEYNGLGMPVLIIDSLGNETVIEYDYNYRNDFNQGVLKTTTTDALGNQQIVIRDTLNRPKVSLRKNSIGETVAKQELFYDAAGNKCLMQDTVFVLGNAESEVLTAWTYNSMGQVLTNEEGVGTPEHKISINKYNIFGQKETFIKPDSTKINHEYDSLGRLVNLFSEDGSIGYEYTYDASSRPVKIVDLVNQSETLRVYDSNGCLSKEVLGNGLTMQYEYDRLSRPTKEILPDNSGIQYVYNAAGLREVHRLDASNETLYSYSYDQHDLAGHILSCNLIGNLGKLTYTHDQLGRTTSITTPFWSQMVTGSGFDCVGNLLQVKKTDIVGSLDLAYTYDDLYQLTSETGDVSHRYQNDSLYNRISKDGADLAINVLNQILSDSDSSYKYDLNGNLIEKKSGDQCTKYIYDALDRLVTVQLDNQRICYDYDSFNRRLSKKVFSLNSDGSSILNSVAKFLYQGQDDLGSIDEEGNYIELRILGIGKGAEIGAAIAIEIKNRVFAPIHDEAGNVVSLVDMESAQVVETYRYTAFGEEQIFDESGLKVDESVIGNPWRFSSKRYDIETGFVYFGRRYYDANIGRWVTPDPIGFEGGPNLYAYVMNSPLMHFDMYGLSWERWGDNWNHVKDDKGYAPNDLGGQAMVNAIEQCRSKDSSWGPVQFFGSMIETVSSHILPFGIGLQDIFCKIGQCLQGNGENLSVKHSVNGTYSTGKNVDKHAVMGVGGILNPFNQFIKDVAMISNSFGGVDVRYTSNASHGFCSDILECMAQILGIPTNSVRHFTENLRHTLEQVGPDGTVTVVVHSQGGLILYRSLEQLSADQRAQINVVTLGSARIISSNDFGLMSARNYISSCDGVPFISDPINYMGAKLNDNSDVSFIESKSLPLIDHGFDNKIYQTALERVGFNFRQTHGLL